MSEISHDVRLLWNMNGDSVFNHKTQNEQSQSQFCERLKTFISAYYHHTIPLNLQTPVIIKEFFEIVDLYQQLEIESESKTKESFISLLHNSFFLMDLIMAVFPPISLI